MPYAEIPPEQVAIPMNLDSLVPSAQGGFWLLAGGQVQRLRGLTITKDFGKGAIMKLGEDSAKIGIDVITFETDYPHQDSTWPRSTLPRYEKPTPLRVPRASSDSPRAAAAGTCSIVM